MVRAGECMASLAKRYGFRDWRTIYAHPDNDELRAKRPNPNHLHPGDEVVVPDKEQRIEARSTGARHTFVVRGGPTQLRIRLRGMHALRYRLEVGGKIEEGAGTMVEHDIEPDADEAMLHVWLADTEAPTVSWRLALGHVDPIDEDSGAKRRLDNLGFATTHGHHIDEATERAAAAFERAEGAEPTGSLTDALKQRLRRAHDEE